MVAPSRVAAARKGMPSSCTISGHRRSSWENRSQDAGSATRLTSRLKNARLRATSPGGCALGSAVLEKAPPGDDGLDAGVSREAEGRWDMAEQRGAVERQGLGWLGDSGRRKRLLGDAVLDAVYYLGAAYVGALSVRGRFCGADSGRGCRG